MDVKVVKKKTQERNGYEERLDSHQSLANFLLLLIVTATVCGVCVYYVYHVAQRVYSLEQRVELMSDRCSPSVRPVTAMSRSTTGQTSGTSTASTTSVVSTSSPVWGKLSNDVEYEHEYIDERVETDDDPEVSGEVLDDDENAEESSGENLHEERSYFSSQGHFYSSRRKRSAVASPPSDDSSPRRQQQRRQQQQQPGRRRSGHRAMSDGTIPPDSVQSRRTSGGHRRRDRQRSDRHRHRSHADTLAGQLALVRQP